MKYLLGFVLLLVGLITFCIGLYFKTDIQEPVEPAIVISSSTPTLTVSPTAKIELNIPWDNEIKAYELLASHSSEIKEIFPHWYFIDSGEMLQKSPAKFKAEITQLAREAGIQIIPSIVINSKTKFLPSEEIKGRLIDRIMNEINQNGYNGVSLHVEQVPTTNEEYYLSFKDTLERLLRNTTPTPAAY